MKKFKEYNEYGDKLSGYELSELVHKYSYEKLVLKHGDENYSPECFTIIANKENGLIINDEWSGLISEGHNFLFYRYTLGYLVNMLIDLEKIYVYVKPIKNNNWTIYVDNLSGKLITKKHVNCINYNEVLEKGLIEAFNKIIFKNN